MCRLRPSWRRPSVAGSWLGGFRIAAKASDRAVSYGVRVNPPKSERAAFEEGDRVIVLADD